MIINPSEVRSWCDLETCKLASVPQDCILLGSIVVCKPCLIDLGEGVGPIDLARLEEEITHLRDTIDKLEEHKRD